jgi:hypothetical protein
MAARTTVLRVGRIILGAIGSAGQKKREGPFCNRASQRVSTRRRDGRAFGSEAAEPKAADLHCGWVRMVCVDLE